MADGSHIPQPAKPKIISTDEYLNRYFKEMHDFLTDLEKRVAVLETP